MRLKPNKEEARVQKINATRIAYDAAYATFLDARAAVEAAISAREVARKVAGAAFTNYNTALDARREEQPCD